MKKSIVISAILTGSLLFAQADKNAAEILQVDINEQNQLSEVSKDKIGRAHV